MHNKKLSEYFSKELESKFKEVEFKKGTAEYKQSEKELTRILKKEKINEKR